MEVNLIRDWGYILVSDWEYIFYLIFTDWSYWSVFCCHKAFSIKGCWFEENGLLDDKRIVPISRWGPCILPSILLLLFVVYSYFFLKDWNLTCYLFWNKRLLSLPAPSWRIWIAELTCIEQMQFVSSAGSPMEHSSRKLRDTWNRPLLTKTLLLQVLPLSVGFICYRYGCSFWNYFYLWIHKNIRLVIHDFLADKSWDCQKVEQWGARSCPI